MTSHVEVFGAQREAVGRNTRKQFEQTKELLGEKARKLSNSEELAVLPILHNDHVLFLQFNGWSINLYPDGTWRWEDSSGG